MLILNNYKIQDVIRNQGLTRLRKLNPQGPLSVLTNYDMFHSATSIEELVLDYIYFPGAFGIPMANSVKRLTMTNCERTNRLDKLDVLYSKLRSMSSLEELTWISNTFGEETPTEVIMLPSLHTLSCGHSSVYSEPDPKMWDMLRVPSLKHFEINYRLPSAIGPILSMVTSSNSFITQLQLSLRLSAAISIIEGLTHVEELSLALYDGGINTLIPRLKWDPTNDGNRLLPKLQKLELSRYHTIDQPDLIPTYLVDVIKSRSAISEKHNSVQTLCVKYLKLLKFTASMVIPKEGHTVFDIVKQTGEELGMEISIQGKYFFKSGELYMELDEEEDFEYSDIHY
ncbi:hypothetical protein BDQ17DRAFT_1433387 [Cyathus striatus]|nr:hypothetical protein BDQ17DRAFT_1433387 [Cyathus striatus]